ncbi:MAG: hypothetical protein JWP29_1414 [Rhodoferax sp.]|nr:hypothetical protein [Rhodoferax sp.]
MATKTVSIPKDDTEDFYLGIEGVGFATAEFVLTAVADDAVTSDPSRYRVRVTRNVAATAVSYEYDAGLGFDWVPESLADIKRNRFGAP